jgi:hypothetical protein
MQDEQTEVKISSKHSTPIMDNKIIFNSSSKKCEKIQTESLTSHKVRRFGCLHRFRNRMLNRRAGGGRDCSTTLNVMRIKGLDKLTYNIVVCCT